LHTAWKPIHGLLFFALFAAAASILALHLWPLFWLAPLAGYGVLVLAVRPLRASFTSWRVGRITPAGAVAAVLIAAASCAVLVAFHHFARPDVTPHAALLPIHALGGVILAGILFALFNALFEEVIFRAILFDALAAQWGARLAVFGSAVLFGLGHLQGYPPGPFGAVLAGIFGLALGWLRVFTGGLALPVATHIAADATIFVLIFSA
jgi:membrane protease YdiL (CAAX protease family)